MNCRHCGQKLSDAQYRGNYKSCPNCSQRDGTEHIFYPNSHFGWTEKRVTENNPTGIQSWCSRCRADYHGPHAEGIKCSELDRHR